MKVIRLVILDKAKICKRIFHYIYRGRLSRHVWCMRHSASFSPPDKIAVRVRRVRVRVRVGKNSRSAGACSGRILTITLTLTNPNPNTNLNPNLGRVPCLACLYIQPAVCIVTMPGRRRRHDYVIIDAGRL